jgi:hypothetical protein
MPTFRIKKAASWVYTYEVKANDAAHAAEVVDELLTSGELLPAEQEFDRWLTYDDTPIEVKGGGEESERQDD